MSVTPLVPHVVHHRADEGDAEAPWLPCVDRGSGVGRRRVEWIERLGRISELNRYNLSIY